MSELQLLKLGLLGLWSAWFGLVVLANGFDALQRAGILSSRWCFVSGNFQRICDAVAVYRCPPWCAALLYGGVILWQTLAALLMLRALSASLTGPGIAVAEVNQAFACALGLWAAFLLAEEVFRQYRTESKHLLFFTAQLLTLIALHLLPD